MFLVFDIICGHSTNQYSGFPNSSSSIIIDCCIFYLDMFLIGNPGSNPSSSLHKNVDRYNICILAGILRIEANMTLGTLTWNHTSAHRYVHIPTLHRNGVKWSQSNRQLSLSKVLFDVALKQTFSGVFMYQCSSVTMLYILYSGFVKACTLLPFHCYFNYLWWC